MCENKNTIPKGCPNNFNCSHRKKDFETLQKHFPYCSSKNLKDLQIEVCEICKSEWNIPRFKNNIEKGGMIMEELKVKKLTKKEMFGELIRLAEENERTDLIAFCEHEIDLINKKASASGQTKTQTENEKIKVVIIEELTRIARAVTISELIKESESLGQYSNQKLSALLKQMVEVDKTATKIVDKKKSLFTIAE